MTPKYPWLATIPDTWRVTNLGNVARVGTGDADLQDASDDGAYPFVVRSDEVRRLDTYTHDTEAVLTAGDGKVGEIFHHMRGKFAAHQRVYVIEPDQRLETRFLYYAMKASFLDSLSGTTAKSTVESLRRPMVTGFQIPVPPLEEQRRIADYLDRETAEIDALIAELNRLQSLLLERRNEFLWRSFGTSTFVPLKRAVAQALTGPFGTLLSADEYVVGGVPVVNPTHIIEGKIREDPQVTVTPETAKRLQRYRMTAGDIVLGRKGEVDKSAIVQPVQSGYVCGSDSMSLRPASGFSSEYLWWFLQSPYAHAQLQEWSVGSTVSGINQRTISEVLIPDMNIPSQDELVQRLKKKQTIFEGEFSDLEAMKSLAAERRSALISAAVTGQIDVTNL
ncbi:MAG: restriction endonuclease subunit S [Galactobacter sp.]